MLQENDRKKNWTEGTKKTDVYASLHNATYWIKLGRQLLQ